MKILRSLSFTAIAASLAAACASAPVPQQRVVSSESAIRGAAEAGAETVPAATLHMRLAQEQRQKAMQLIEQGENERAAYLLARSEADAELAIALSRQARAEQEAARQNEVLP